MRFKKVVNMFENGNVSVSGLRGRGKDVLMSNVIARRKQPYICNVDYNVKADYIPLDLNALDCKNTYLNFITGRFNKYTYPYADKVDVYVSDAGIYFPSQYSSQLDKQFTSLSVYQAISRHLGDCNFHHNAQNLNRVWNKIREQSDIYIRCNKCIVLFGKIVIQSITVYDKYQSCVDNVEPYKHIKPPMFCNQETKAQYLARDEVLYRQFCNSYGKIKTSLLIYINKAKFDSRFIKKMLEGSQS